MRERGKINHKNPRADVNSTISKKTNIQNVIKTVDNSKTD